MRSTAQTLTGVASNAKDHSGSAAAASDDTAYNAPGLATGHPACHTLHFLLLHRRGVGLRRELNAFWQGHHRPTRVVRLRKLLNERLWRAGHQ